MLNKPAEYTATIKFNGMNCEFTDVLELPEFTAKLICDDERVRIRVVPAQEVEFEEIFIEAKLTVSPEDRVFMNGYQSWTDSREYSTSEKMRGINQIPMPLVRKYNFDKYGDYGFVGYSSRKGDFHGFSYGYIRRGDEYMLMGSVSERSGFTVFELFSGREKLRISRDCDGAVYGVPFDALDIVTLTGTEEEVFDRWFALMEIDRPKAQPIFGYTSWYRHYQDISEIKLLHDLEAVAKSGVRQDIFQIDDGYQTAVGDWLSINKQKFPNGIACISEAAHNSEMLSGLWLAPFVCERDSDIYRNKKDWLLKGPDGAPLPAGCNWSGSFVLDFYNEEVREYLREVFRTVLHEWGFDMVKLDFLYAVCIRPQQGKSRGQIMCEAMDFLRECVGHKLLLGCGVPLMPAFGKCDYCRIGCDVGLSWNDNAVMQLTHRERVSTKNSMLNTVFRRQLDGRAFLNDPDVFLLRDDNISLYHCQKQSLAIINHVLGSVYFTSDDVSGYDDRQRRLLATARRWSDARVLRAEWDKGEVKLTLSLRGRVKTITLLPDGRLK